MGRIRSLAVFITAVALATSCSAGGGDNVVTVVTHDAFLVSDEVIAAFESETGLDVQFLTSADVGTLVTEASLTRSKPIADVLFGIDNTFLSRGLDDDLFAPYSPPGLATVPSEFQADPDHRVTPIDYGDVCVNVSDSLDISPPTSFDDLRDPAYASQWVTQNPETSSPGLAMLLATIAVYGEEGWEAYWADVAANGLEVTAGWTEAYFGSFVAGGGDRAIVTSYASSPVAEVALAETPMDEPTTSIIPSTCFRQIEFAGVLANAENPEGAQEFIDFMLTDTFQNDVPLNMFVYPVSTTASLPEVFVDNTTVVAEPLRLDAELIGEMRDQWTARWVEIVLR